jgi:hypothetical protein
MENSAGFPYSKKAILIFVHLLFSSSPQQYPAYLELLTENPRFQSMKPHLVQSETHWLHLIIK